MFIELTPAIAATLTADPGPDCVHCGRRQPHHGGRGLCRRCYFTPAIRGRYPPKKDCGRRGTGHSGHGLTPPPAPTSALPGTAEKVAVLEDRAANRWQLWHPGDATGDMGPLTWPRGA